MTNDETQVNGYEAAARECERLGAEMGGKEQRAVAQCARIIREHEQHARPVVDREGLVRVLCEHAERHGDMNAPGAADAILAHLGARGDERSTAAAVPASEPFREAVRLGDEPSDVDAPGAIAALRALTASAPAPAASEPVVTDAMVVAYIAGVMPGGCSAADPEAVRAGLRAALAAAPQRVRDVGEDVARFVARRFYENLSGVTQDTLTDALVHDMGDAIRAAGLVVAVPDGEWAALVAERDEAQRTCKAVGDELEATVKAVATLLKALSAKTIEQARNEVRALYHDRFELRNDVEQLKEQLAAATAERDGLRAEVEKERKAALSGAALLAFKAECYDLRDQLAAATKRADEAERDCAALREGLAKAHEQYDASQARVRELEAQLKSFADGLNQAATHLGDARRERDKYRASLLEILALGEKAIAP